MKKDFSALSFAEKERICEGIFISNGPYWHIYTYGTRMQNIFYCEEDFKTGMWCLAAGVHLCKGVLMLTFELMANHVHLILAGKRDDCIEAFERFAARLKKAFPKRERAIDWSQFKMDILPIESLQALPILTQRGILHTRDITPFADLKEIDSMPFIPSFCDIKLGESLFRDARSYFNSLTRNAEAFSQIASRLKDAIFLTDEELYSVICSHISKEYSVKAPAQLSAQQKIDTARHMHFDYNATNQQLRRMLRMDLSVLEELFP